MKPNVLLDLSNTLLRYQGSSLDRDIAWLFRSFDRRICIGSDYPDYEPGQLRARFEQAMAWAEEGLWSSAAAAFDTLSADGADGAADRNVGLCRRR